LSRRAGLIAGGQLLVDGDNAGKEVGSYRAEGNIRSAPMCDYSLHHVNTRPAKVGDKLTARDFGLGTRGFAAPEDKDVAVCLLPGTELSFAGMVVRSSAWGERVINYKTAIFRQVNQEKKWVHHDALEFPNGEIVMLTHLQERQQATVLQLPASAGVRAQQETGRASEVSQPLHIALGI
jgi:hypothetical protein